MRILELSADVMPFGKANIARQFGERTMSRKPDAAVVTPVDAFLASTVPALKSTVAAKRAGKDADVSLSAAMVAAIVTLWNICGDLAAFLKACGALFGVNRNAKDGTRVFGSFENAISKDDWKVLPVGYLSRCITLAENFHRADVRTKAAESGLQAAAALAKPPKARVPAPVAEVAAPVAVPMTVETCIAFLHAFAINGKDPIVNSKIADVEYHLGSKTQKQAP